MNAETRKKDRSPNFPFIPLESALARAQQFYGHMRRGGALFPSAAELWGYSHTSSGAMQTVAALKSYGLMSDEGSGASRRVRLTDLALRILLDPRPNSAERERYKRQAALSPAIAAEIYEKWGAELPSDAALNHYLVLERGFNQSTALKVAKIILANEEFTKKDLGDRISANLETSRERVERPMIAIASDVSLGDTAVTSRAPPQLKVERILGPTGEITIQFAGEPTWDAYHFLEQYIGLRMKLLKKVAPSAQVEEGTQKESDAASGQES